jgi:hypothetical protein
MLARIIFGGMLLVLGVAGSSLAGPKPQKKETAEKRDFTILSVKNQVMYFKVAKTYVGGWIEIFDENKNCLEADSLPHTHTMIYFDEMPPGNYTVKVKKGQKKIEFSYESI